MDATFWQRQLEAFYNAPIACAFFLAIGAIAAWWFRGTTMSGERNGLKAQISVLEERLRLAAEKVEQRDEAKGRLESDLNKLEEQIAANAPRKAIEAASASAHTNFILLGQRDNEICDLVKDHLDPEKRLITAIFGPAGNEKDTPLPLKGK